MSMGILITIDGGAATGKSTTSRAVAERLELMHVDTGSHYRTLSLLLLRAGVAAEAGAEIESALAEFPLNTVLVGRSAYLAVDGQAPQDSEIRSEAVNASVSAYSGIPSVREKLKAYQRAQLGDAVDRGFRGLVMEGRDIGSVIFPDAQHRFFLEADPETRAQRRAAEGQTDSIEERDRKDSSRKTAPLVCPQGALQIDTGVFSVDAVVAQIVEAVSE
ncbi:MAG: (d)CMP kinase [Opitutales bacterium]|nr:(d)CMP kinase [Opitutales bacterium]NRA26420.1 (d)CMP kinase [Opitutales bacterium]